MKKVNQILVVFLVLLTPFASKAEDSLESVYFNWRDLHLKDAIREIHGDGSRKIAVFTEPECGYCRKYEETLTKTMNVTIYRFLMPLDVNQMRRSIGIWCSGKSNSLRLQTLHLVMHENNSDFQSVDCANPISANMAFGHKYDIYMTPTTINSDGRLIQGYLPLSNLEQWLGGRGAFD